jgi:hypothetical protein
MSQPNAPPSNTRVPRYQADDLGLKAILTVAVLLVLGGIIILVVLYFVMFRFVRNDQAQDPPPSPYAAVPQRAMDAPHLEAPLPDDYYAAQYAHLHEFRWIDRESGILRIPIERAMELIVERARKKESSR